MLPYGLIRRKRDGEELPPESLRRFLEDYQAGRVADYHVAAFLMAVYFRGLTASELDALVEVLLGSGARVDFGGAPGLRIDKHSTGGVGDKVSLVLAPLVASLGVQVPMMSGRGLGHSGGTVDKLESIPGFRMDLPLPAFREQVLRLGLAMIGQTEEVAPLDRRLYALRDVTATVESIPLIASSIMSKKIAEGIDGLVLDVKAGDGAFLPEEERALELARTMIRIGEGHGLRVVALVTTMDRPLGRAVGNALEVREALDTLRGGGPPDLRAVTVALAAEMLVMGEAASSLEEGRALADAALDDGRALAKMRELIAAQGGEVAVIDDDAALPAAPVRRILAASESGTVRSMATRTIGEAAVELGAGRRAIDDAIDPAVGFVLKVAPGDPVVPGQALAEIHAADPAAADRAAQSLRASIEIGDAAPEGRALISHRVTRRGVDRLA